MIEKINLLEPTPAAPSSKRKDIAVGSPHLQEVQKQIQAYIDNQQYDLLSRIFYAMPGRRTRAGFGLLGQAGRPDPQKAYDVLHFGSYNYSGLNGHPRVIAAAQAALQHYGTTSSGVRLLNGTSDLHMELERTLAGFLGVEDVITYSSGFMANVSVLSALCGEGDVVLSDMLNHQSILAGLKLSGAEIRTYRHRNTSSLEAALRKLSHEQRKIITTDGVFSMDGDVADLPGIVELADHYNAIVIVDDAHGTAAIGPNGRGTPAFFGMEDRVDVLLGSLSKGLPGIGGFAAGPKATIDLLRFGSSGYIFSASLPPPIVAGLIEAVRILQEQPGIQEKLHHNENALRDGIRKLGLDCMSSESPIIPILMPSLEMTSRMARALHKEGIYVNPVGPPAVSKNRTRLRLNASANLEPEDIARFLEALERTGREVGLLGTADKKEGGGSGLSEEGEPLPGDTRAVG